MDIDWRKLMMVEDNFNFKQYKEGKISLGTLAKELDLSISETIDLLAEYGITSPISYDDYLEGLETLKQLP